MTSSYEKSRFTFDKRRAKLWSALWRYYFRFEISDDSTVIDLGAGYCDFINSVKSDRKIAIDINPDIRKYADKNVETIVGPVTDLSAIHDKKIDYAFASNLFEHISQDELASLLEQLKKKLNQNGRLTLLQPNYRYAFKEYFDDYTHITIYSHISMCDFLTANGFEVLSCKPKFLPLSIKSKLPVADFLIRLYLLLPIKPFGKQMLISAKVSR